MPDNVKSVFKPIPTKMPGMQFTELLPKLAQVIDKFTLIRSMSYTPIGLFNHTAAIYQMHTGYTADKVSPSGQLEPPTPKDFPNFGSNIIRLKPPTVPMLPFVMMPRPLQESNVVGKGGTAGFLGRAYDPYYLYPPGDDMDMNKMDRIKVDDLKLRPEVTRRPARTPRPPARPDQQGHAGDRQGRRQVRPRRVLRQGAEPGPVGPGPRGVFDLNKEADEMRERYGRNTFGQCCLLARRLVEAGTRVVEVIWPKVANSDNHSWDVHVGLSGPHEEPSRPRCSTRACRR